MRVQTFILIWILVGIVFTSIRVNEISQRKPIVDTMYMITVPQVMKATADTVKKIRPVKRRKMPIPKFIRIDDSLNKQQ